MSILGGWYETSTGGCTSDVSSTSSLIVPSLMMLFDDLPTSKNSYICRSKIQLGTEGRMDGGTDGDVLLSRCAVASKKKRQSRQLVEAMATNEKRNTERYDGAVIE